MAPKKAEPSKAKTGKKAEKEVKRAPKKEKAVGPKRAMSAYMMFGIERRKKLIEERPELKSQVAQVGKILGAEWREMTEEQKKPFQAKADKDKERYQKEKEAK